MQSNTAKNIDDYIAGFPADVQDMLQQIRAAIRKVAPGALEDIKYAIPTFVLDGKNLVHFAAFKNHIGFYPTPTGIESFKKELLRLVLAIQEVLCLGLFRLLLCAQS